MHLFLYCTHTHCQIQTHSDRSTANTTIIHLLEKAGDVVFAACGPGERVGVGCYVGRHQFGCLVAFGTAGIPDPIVVHPKTETHTQEKKKI